MGACTVHSILDISQDVTLGISSKRTSVSHQGSIDKCGTLVSMNAVARTAIAKNQIRASRAIYRFTDRGSRPRSQRRVFRLPVRPLGKKKISCECSAQIRDRIQTNSDILFFIVRDHACQSIAPICVSQTPRLHLTLDSSVAIDTLDIDRHARDF